MPDHTTTSAAQYLADHGYTVKRRRVGGEGPPSADTIKRWCITKKIKARKAGHAWLITQRELDRLLKAQAPQPPAAASQGGEEQGEEGPTL